MNGLVKDPVVGDPTAVVTFADEVLEGLIRNVSVVVDEDADLLEGYLQVGIVEGVGDVPSDGSVSAPLLHQSVEEAKTEAELAQRESLDLVQGLDPFIQRIGMEGAQQVVLQPDWRLVGDFHSVLED